MDRTHRSKPENFTKELEVFRGLGERKLRNAIECMPGRAR
jgi:hypothetical protein